MLFKLSFKNIKKSIKDFSIYFFTLVVAVAIFYCFNSIDAQSSMMSLTSSKQHIIEGLVEIIGYVSIFVSVILGFLIIYSNNFIIKRRKKEIGLYMTLGMSKRKISLIFVLETLLIGVISLGVGLLLGIFLSQILSIFTAKLFEVNMNAFKFIFSFSALKKTIIYFGIIFIIVMILNVLNLNRCKLIDLINANKKIEKMHIRNKWISIVSFIISIVLISYAYYLLFHENVLYELNEKTGYMIIAGAIATLLFFFSLSGFLLAVVSKFKKTYYKDLNIFILKQINSKIKTNVITTTIICLMLLLTIGILSGSLSMANAFNVGFEENNLTDFTLYNFCDVCETNKINIDNIINSNDFNRYVKEYVKYDLYEVDGVTVGALLNDNMKEKIQCELSDSISFDVKLLVIKESDYKNLLHLFGKDEDIIDLKDNQYLELANIEELLKYFEEPLKENNTIEVSNKIYYPAIDHVYQTAIENYPGEGNDGIVVLPDSTVENEEPVYVRMVGNYKDASLENVDDDFKNLVQEITNSDYYLRTKIDMEASSTGIKLMLTFIGIYLGIIFAISSVTILAIGQLTEASDNKERFGVIRKIGADDKLINRALFIQIGISFLLPLVVAVFHAIFGLSKLNDIIKLLGHLDLFGNILITSIFIITIYGGYFIATYLISKRIIKES